MHGILGMEVLIGVFHVPELAVSLFSARAALASGKAVSYSPPETQVARRTIVLARSGRVILTASKSNGLYIINGQCTAWAAALIDPDELSSAVTWHRRLGHLGFSTIADIVNVNVNVNNLLAIARSNLIQGCLVTLGAFLQAQKLHLCEPCIAIKLRRTSHPRRAP